jgi:hypothetical protein
VWRRGWDSNPRLSFPNTRFPSVLLKPLGHLSAFWGVRSLTNWRCGSKRENRSDSAGGNKSGSCLLHFLALLRGSAIGSTPAFGAGYPGSSPGPGAKSFEGLAGYFRCYVLLTFLTFELEMKSPRSSFESQGLCVPGWSPNRATSFDPDIAFTSPSLPNKALSWRQRTGFSCQGDLSSRMAVSLN